MIRPPPRSTSTYTLVPYTTLFRSVRDSVKIGAIEGGIMCISYAPGKAPLSGVLDLPFLPFKDLEVQKKVHEIVYKHPAIAKELAHWDAIPFFSALLPQSEFLGVGHSSEERR